MEEERKGSGTHWGECLGERVRIKAGNGVKVSEDFCVVPAAHLRRLSYCSQEPSER